MWLNRSKGFLKYCPATEIELGCPFALRVALRVGSCHQCSMHYASTSPRSFATVDEMADIHRRCVVVPPIGMFAVGLVCQVWNSGRSFAAADKMADIHWRCVLDPWIGRFAVGLVCQVWNSVLN